MRFSAALICSGLVALVVLPSPTGGAGFPDWRRPGEQEAKLLRDALRKGDLAQVRAWLDEGLKVGERLLPPWEQFERTPLEMAIVAGRIDATKLFLDAGAEPDQMAVSHFEADGAKTVHGPKDRQFHEEVFSPLMCAAAVGLPEMVTELISRGADVNQAGKAGVTALMAAAVHNRPAVVRLLLAKGADANAVINDVPYVRGLEIQHLCLPLSARSPTPSHFFASAGASALWLAAFSGHKGVVDALLAGGADPGVPADCTGVRDAPAGLRKCTAAELAGVLGNRDILAALGGGPTPAVSVRASTPEEQTRLWKKIRDLLRKDDVDGLRLYLESGLKVDEELAKDGEGTPLVMAAMSGAVKSLRLLLDAGADVDLMSTTGKGAACWSALMMAITWKRDACVAVLLDAGADIDLAGCAGHTAINLAAYNGDVAVLRRLLSAGADPETRAKPEKPKGPFVDGATPLWIAAWMGKGEAVRFLLETGADPAVEAACAHEREAAAGETVCTPRRIAELRGNPRVVALLDEILGPAPSATEEDLLDARLPRAKFQRRLLKLVTDRDVGELGRLIGRGLDVDTEVDMGGLVPLVSYAAHAGRAPVVALLLARGADPRRMSRNRMSNRVGYTGFVVFPQDRNGQDNPGGFVSVYPPLVYASAVGLDVVSLLLNAGADVNARGFAGVTPLMVAAESNLVPIVKRLLAAGAELEARVENRERTRNLRPHGATALWLACAAGAEGSVGALLEAGADTGALAECRRPGNPTVETNCDCRRIAELGSSRGVVAALDRRSGVAK